ncbi:MAG: extracellular solute-binding protein, partial [Anaerolineales bacterium]|nr:extracellular solute-binding protein [Anaerolineales bacterium]
APAEEAAPAEETAPTEEAAPAEEAAPTEETAAPAEEAMGDKVQIRWFVGLGTGTDPQQVATQEEVVADFNASQDAIELVLEIVPYDSARDTLATQIASGNGPDIIGPVGWGGSNAFYGQWLDIGPYIESTGFDTSVFDPALVDSYQTEEGQVGLPFAVFPSAVYYVPAYFDEVGLAYPPAQYGEMYELDGEMVEWNWDTFTEVARRLTIDANGANAVEDGFDPTQIVQVGYSPQWQTHVNYVGSYVAGAAKIVEGDAPGNYSVNMPDSWKEAVNWLYDGMWGDQPFTATGPLSGAPEFGNGNLFNSGKAAMAITPLWYTCCLGEFRDAGLEFQAGAMPVGADGQVHGRVDADTFRIWKGTQHPEEAFTVLSYLITTGGDKLLPQYGALPAIAEKQDAFFEVKSQDYPFVTPETWEVFKAGLAYPDAPSAEQFQPNWNEAWAREQTFFDLIQNTPPSDLDFDAEWQKMIDDVNAIYNKE